MPVSAEIPISYYRATFPILFRPKFRPKFVVQQKILLHQPVAVVGIYGSDGSYVATSLSCPPQILNMLLGPRFAYLSRMGGRFGILDCLKAKGTIHIGRPHWEGKGGTQKEDEVREFALIIYCTKIG